MDEKMVKERDEESGRYTKSISDDEILAFVGERGGVGTAEVADAFDYKQPSAYRRLKRLEEEGRVASRKVGNAKLWRLAESE
ncbi:winged helix-turn-helix domain-containing protein [Halobium palmae]|uniref:Winged helix-turn-helix domain-containing protein n=1 Tax=Halobium palmae TaxID=1776492 RepID=A0ABD5RWW8_9EURY